MNSSQFVESRDIELSKNMSFLFAMFDDDTNVSSLSEFLSHVDETYDFVGFEKIQITIANV